jgi:phosphomannomutase
VSDALVFHSSILREYDIRGVVGKTLSPDDALAVGRAFGTVVARQGGKTVCLGYDGRLSSPDMQEAVAEGLMAAGIRVVRIGLGPTPMLYFAVNHLEADAGIMVTGSHNPPTHNGFKMMLGKRPFYGKDIRELGRIAAEGDYVKAAKGRLEEFAIEAIYVDRLLEGFDAKPMRMAWDPGNGAAGRIVDLLVKRLPGEHLVINSEIDGTFPAHHPDPTEPENLEQVQALVRDNQLDFAVAFDGDADRLGAIDGRGDIVWGDSLLAILARDVLKELPGATIIADVKASQVLFDQITKLGGMPLMWRTGHSLIKSKMAETGAPLAGEMSGHIFFAHRYYGFDDALYAAIRLMLTVSHSGRSLTSLHDELPKVINTPELRFPCGDERKFEVVREVKDRLSRTGAKVNDIDGVRVSNEDGWWLLRASNTQDVLVARCEAASAPALRLQIEQLCEALRASGIEPPQI